MNLSKPFILVLDGPRGSGKSTTGKALVDRFQSVGLPSEYVKVMRATGKSETQHMMELYASWKQETKIWVIDRFAASEWVMSLLFNRVSSYTQLTCDCSLVNQYVVSNGASYILMADVSVLDARIIARNENRTWEVTPEIIPPMWRAAAGALNCHFLDTTQMNQKQVIEKIFGDVMYDLHECDFLEEEMEDELPINT